MGKFEKSLQGKLLLDSGKLIGSYFDRSVILMCRHDESGAFGLVLNRPLPTTLGSVLKEDIAAGLAKTPLFQGGPVQPEALSFLYETELRPEFEILPWVSLGHSLEELKKIHETEGKRIRAFSGYSGWAAGQLEEEMDNECWIVHKASLSMVFSSAISNLWQKIMQDKGGVFEVMSHAPDDPSLN